MLAQAGAEDVKRHKWFKGVDWEDVYYRFVTCFNFNFIFIIVITVHQGVDLGFLLWILSPTSQKNYLSQSRHHHLSWPDHRFCLNFTSSSLRKLKPPLVPKLKYEGDTSNFDDYPEDDLNKVPGVSEREQRIFDDF